MGGEDDRDVVGAGGRGDRAQDLGGVGAVQRRGGLVGEQDARRAGQGTGDGDALALRLVEAAGALAGAQAHVEPVQPFAGGLFGGAVTDAAQQQGKGGVLPGGQLGDEVRFGVHPAEPVQAQPFTAERGECVHG